MLVPIYILSHYLCCHAVICNSVNITNGITVFRLAMFTLVPICIHDQY